MKLGKIISYSGKFLREKIFTDPREVTILWRNFLRMLRPIIGGYGTPKFHFLRVALKP